MSSRRHRKGCISADSLYKQVLHCIFVLPCIFMSYIVFSCLPVGTGRVMSSHIVSVLIVYINKIFVLPCIFMSSRRHRKGRIGAKINVIELQRCYFVGKWEYYRGCR